MKLHRRGNASGKAICGLIYSRRASCLVEIKAAYPRSRVAEAACKFAPNSPPNTHLPRKGDIYARALNFPRETRTSNTRRNTFVRINYSKQPRALWRNFNFNSLSSLTQSQVIWRRRFFYSVSERECRLRELPLPFAHSRFSFSLAFTLNIHFGPTKNLLNSISTPPVPPTPTSCFHLCFCGENVFAHTIAPDIRCCER